MNARFQKAFPTLASIAVGVIPVLTLMLCFGVPRRLIMGWGALLFFLFVVPRLGLAQLIGFGTAAGAIEAIVLPFIGNPLKGTPLEKHSSEVFEKASSGMLLSWMSVLERVLALIPHIAARGLVYVSFVSGNFIPAVLAVMTFAMIDGGAYFGHLEKWQFDRVSVLRKAYLSLATIGVCQTALFAIFYHALM